MVIVIINGYLVFNDKFSKKELLLDICVILYRKCRL